MGKKKRKHYAIEKMHPDIKKAVDEISRSAICVKSYGIASITKNGSGKFQSYNGRNGTL